MGRPSPHYIARTPPIRSCPHGPRLGSAANCWAVGPGNSSLGGKAYAWWTLPLVYKSPFMYDITDGDRQVAHLYGLLIKVWLGAVPPPSAEGPWGWSLRSGWGEVNAETLPSPWWLLPSTTAFLMVMGPPGTDPHSAGTKGKMRRSRPGNPAGPSPIPNTAGPKQSCSLRAEGS